MKMALLALVIVSGILNTVQTGSNSTLRKALDLPLFATVIVFAVGLLVSMAVWVAGGARTPTAAAIHSVPWWGWVGGSLGALYILSIMLAADKLGAAIFMGATVTLAVVTSLVMDHFGLMGFEVHRAGVGRLVGGALMVGGLALIAKY